MKKSKAWIILLCLVLVLAGITYVDLYGVDAKGTGSASDIKLGLDLAGGVSITYQVVGDATPDATDMKDTIYKLQQRVEGYSTEAIVYQEGANRINIEIPGVQDANEILKELGRPGALYFIREKDDEGNTNYTYNGSGYTLNKTIDEMLSDGSIPLTGTDVKSAEAATQQDNMNNNEIVVSLVMNENGADKFAEMTREAYNNNNATIAIYYDGQIVSAPRVQAVITDGRAVINGQRSYEEAEQLASTIRIGGLKLELEEIHSKVVGAQLGSEAIRTSLMAGAIGLAIVAAFMIVVYFVSGFASVIALCIYVSLVVLLIRGFDMTLTLSGVAGIILSIGMAVDANVIIFARIREELATGKTTQSAIKIGFDKALSAIIDGNVTTLIAAAVLMFLAPGSIKGFAQTLALGIVISMFTALVITRLLMNALYALGIKNAKWYGIGKERKSINFLGKKGIFFGLSIAVIVAGFVVMGVYASKADTDALNYSLEFKGGTATTVTFNEKMSVEDADAKIVPVITEVTGSAVQVQTVQDTNEIIFKTNTLNLDQRAALEDRLVSEFGVERDLITTETISSTISNEMKRDTIIAVVVAIACMLIYIRIRFSDIRFGVSSIVALCHDVLVVLAFYAIARVSVGNTFIACMLTIVGYSINASIVIFDRVRENMNEMSKKDSIEDVVNKSITQTLSRSIFTSLTTFVMVACLYVLGVTSIRDFALPLMVGIVCGAYSSVCIVGGLWYVLRKKFPAKAK
ncbi:MAG: protein translocase subunit SecD [Lachnospiraceae bacterium]|nr:protein translocase subunit SecD [Lachnospiraceae bacterium]